jgi:hypothetical protein
VAFTIGIIASIVGDRRDPDADEHRRERAEAMYRRAEPQRDMSKR